MQVQKKTILRLSPYEKIKAEILFSSSWNSRVLFPSCNGGLEITLFPDEIMLIACLQTWYRMKE